MIHARACARRLSTRARNDRNKSVIVADPAHQPQRGETLLAGPMNRIMFLPPKGQREEQEKREGRLFYPSPVEGFSERQNRDGIRGRQVA